MAWIVWIVAAHASVTSSVLAPSSDASPYIVASVLRSQHPARSPELVASAAARPFQESALETRGLCLGRALGPMSLGAESGPSRTRRELRPTVRQAGRVLQPKQPVRGQKHCKVINFWIKKRTVPSHVSSHCTLRKVIVIVPSRGRPWDRRTPSHGESRL